ncbi:MAG: cobalamin-binding protein, partial [Ignavibacteria bacterium]|nr:cobalamin-binding protein [Ignavibacteria bacterium]
MKIASLLSSGTEIAVTLGAESELAGISHECDYPDSIRHLPVLTESRIDHMARSDIIHMQVQERLIKALSIYNVKTELLSSLKPDVIITQHQCEVCAVSFSDVCNAISDLVNMNVEIVSLNPASLQEIFEDIRRIASAIKRNPETVIDKMKSKIEEVRQRTASLKNKPRVAFIEWIKPIFIGSNWMPELIEIAGGIPLFGESGKKSHIIEFSELVKSDPDVIIIAPCGFKLSQTEKDLNLLTSETGWEELKAVRNKKVYITDGNSYFNRSGPRITESLELLAGLI